MSDDPAGEPLDPTTQHVRKWLKDKGVRLELDVATAFRRQPGVTSVDHARLYIARNQAGERIAREVDVVAQCVAWRFPFKAGVSTWFVVECKSSDKDPWVVYRSESMSRFIGQDSRDLLRETLQFVERGVSVSDLDAWRATEAVGSIFWNSGDYAYQIADTGEDPGKDNSRRSAVSAVQQVLSAVEGAVEDVSLDASRPMLSIFVPVVVTAAPLFAVDARTAEYAVSQVPFVPLIARFRRADALDLVWIVQADSLNEYVEMAVKGANELRMHPITDPKGD